MKTLLVENRYGHGAKKINRVHRYVNRKIKGLASASEPFDWNLGYTRNIDIPIKNQYESFSCAGQAGAYLLQIIKQTVELSAKSIYSPIAYKGGGGTTVVALETQLSVKGAVLETDVPSSIQGDATESFMEDTSWETGSLITEAQKLAGFTPISVKVDIDSIACAIRDYGGVIFEIQGQNNGTWLSEFPKPPVGKQNLWQHFMCSYPNVRLVNGVKTLDFLQSWGNTVGLLGHQFFTEDYINSGHILDVTALVPDNQPIPTGVSFNYIWLALRAFFQSFQTAAAR